MANGSEGSEENVTTADKTGFSKSKSMKPIFYPLVWAVFSMGTLCAQSWMPPDSLADLPVVEGLPGLFTFSNGDAVRTPQDWLRRREELKAI